VGKLDQQAAYQLSGNRINGQATPLSFAASGAFGEGSAKGAFVREAPPSSQSRNALPCGVICQPALSHKINLSALRASGHQTSGRRRHTSGAGRKADARPGTWAGLWRKARYDPVWVAVPLGPSVREALKMALALQGLIFRHFRSKPLRSLQSLRRKLVASKRSIASKRAKKLRSRSSPGLLFGSLTRKQAVRRIMGVAISAPSCALHSHVRQRDLF